jgi:MFS family permease
MHTVLPRNMGVTGSFINMAGQFAAVIAPLIIGVLVTVSNGGFGTTFAFLIGALLVSCGLVLTLPGKWEKPEQPALA